MSKKKTHSEYVDEARIISPNIEVVGQYIASNIKIKHKCKMCGHEWDARPSSILNGRGCPECAKHQRAKSNTKTHEQFVLEVKAVNQNIEIIGKYTNSNAKIEVECKLCGHKWLVRAADILFGHGCPECSYRAKSKTQHQYISELAKVNSNITVIGEYINCYTKIKHLCLKCGHEWMAKPYSILQGNNCPQCSTRRKSHEQYVLELSIKNPDIKIIGEYINANTKIHHRCILCGYEWMVKPNHLLHGLGCPSCKETSGEQLVKQWLIMNDVKYEYQKYFSDCKNMRMLPFDFYLPDYNCCIEYDGAQHFRVVDLWGGEEYLSKRQHNDRIKNRYCEENNIHLIRIRYDEDVRTVLDGSLLSIVSNKAS